MGGYKSIANGLPSESTQLNFGYDLHHPIDLLILSINTGNTAAILQLTGFHIATSLLGGG